MAVATLSCVASSLLVLAPVMFTTTLDRRVRLDRRLRPHRTVNASTECVVLSECVSSTFPILATFLPVLSPRTTLSSTCNACLAIPCLELLVFNAHLVTGRFLSLSEAAHSVRLCLVILLLVRLDMHLLGLEPPTVAPLPSPVLPVTPSPALRV